MKDLIKQSLINSTNCYRAGAGLPMIEAHDEDEARMDREDLIQELLRPHREGYVLSCWNDPQLLVEALTEALNSKKHVEHISELKIKLNGGIRQYIDEYFAEMAEENYKTLDDL